MNGAGSETVKTGGGRSVATMVLASEPAVVEEGVLWAGLDRGELRKQHAAGELQELEFEAVVFRAQYPNWNYVRFRDEEMDAFAASFVGVPFLRNHDMQDIAARDGIVTACCMDGQIARDACAGQADDGGGDPGLPGGADRPVFDFVVQARGNLVFSVCGRMFSCAECPHVPGRTYASTRPGAALRDGAGRACRP